MATKINAKTTRETLEENFESDAKLLKDVSTIFTFASAATLGEPLTWSVGIALLLNRDIKAKGLFYTILTIPMVPTGE